MSSTNVNEGTSSATPEARVMDMKLEVVTLPVADVDEAKRFYQNLGWRLDADIVRGDAFRAVHLTPPHSSCSIAFGKGLTSAERAYSKLVYFNELDRGGHFAAWEQPQLFSEEVRAAFRSLR